jgi:hypothetical protein
MRLLGTQYVDAFDHWGWTSAHASALCLTNAMCFAACSGGSGEAAIG